MNVEEREWNRNHDEGVICKIEETGHCFFARERENGI